MIIEVVIKVIIDMILEEVIVEINEMGIGVIIDMIIVIEWDL